MTYPRYNFSDPTLDYNTVNNTVNDMYSDLLSQSGSCGSKKTESVLNESDRLMRGIEIDLENEDNTRYKESVKSAYLILFNYVSE